MDGDGGDGDGGFGAEPCEAPPAEVGICEDVAEVVENSAYHCDESKNFNPAIFGGATEPMSGAVPEPDNRKRVEFRSYPPPKAP